jgi:23S rRNA pseudouridine1911/1915/1917 synthase
VILTRLYKDTSGLVVMALAPDVHAVMQRDLIAGRVRKEYLVVVEGEPVPANGRIVLPLGRDLADRRRVVVTDAGAPSETHYELLRSLPNGLSLLLCELVTGRTHQIRVHLASRGWPIVGDVVYGRPDAVLGRQALHAWRVLLPHPITRQRLELEAPIPGDMLALLGT